MTKEIEELQYKYKKALDDVVKLTVECAKKDNEIARLKKFEETVKRACCPTPYSDMDCDGGCVKCWEDFAEVEDEDE